MKAGVLALQGDFREHARALADAGAIPVEVRNPEELASVDCLVIPGGESTTSTLSGPVSLPGCPCSARARA